MANLKTLLQYANAGGGGGSGGGNINTLVVYHTTLDTENNGGCCCLWTAPAGVTWFQVEMWGGGGSGGATCCCHSGWPGGSGSYSRKIVETAAAQAYTVCAGGTSCQNRRNSGQRNGCQGYPSYINGTTEGVVVACASGGIGGCTTCYHGSNCSYQGCSPQQCGSYCGTFGMCGVGGGSRGTPNCWGGNFEYMPSAPMTGGAFRQSKDGCSGMCKGCCSGYFSHFPGGGGSTGFNHGDWGTECGMWGGGGLIMMTWSE